VHRSVFERIGFPDTERQLGGHEDKEFLLRCANNGIPVGTVGASVFHHFGSITQKAMKQDSGAKSLGDRHLFYRKVGLGWLARKRWKQRLNTQQAAWTVAEVTQHGHSLHMLRKNQQWERH
jgi:N-acetylglucosaminyl-diphospho-decaprenol L-rhamnosyltransferase